jgi:phosphatidylglycerol:prolipoprotein diacylglycerol transferase
MLRFIEIGNNQFIPAYNLFVGFGIAMAMLLLQYQRLFLIKSETEKHTIHLSLLIAILLGFIGAYIFDAFSQNITLSFDNMNGIGLTFLGGLISGLIVLVICLKMASLPLLPILNLMTLPFCIAHFFGRIGCFMAGCCFGKPTNFLFGVTFPNKSIPHFHYQELIKIHPTQLYESVFILCLVLFITKFKVKNQFYIYLLTYSLFRCMVEFIRADDRGTIFNQDIISPSQIMSLLTATLVILIILTNKILQKQKHKCQQKITN